MLTKVCLLLLLVSFAVGRPDWYSNLEKMHKRLSQRWEDALERQVDIALGNLRTSYDRIASYMSPQSQSKIYTKNGRPSGHMDGLVVEPEAEIISSEDLYPDRELDESGREPLAPRPRPQIPPSIFGDSLGAPFFPGFHNVFRRRDWWKGPNVCQSREEDEEIINSTTSSGFLPFVEFIHCQELPHEYACETKKEENGVKRTYKLVYQCCYGFSRAPGEFGCTLGGELANLVETAEELGSLEFLEVVESLDLKAKLINENLTVFVPTDDAMLDYLQESEIQNNLIPEIKRKKREEDSLVTVMMSHMTHGFHLTSDLADEQVLKSESEGSTIRINKYAGTSEGSIITANCARITSVDNMATNGIIHTTGQVMAPVTKTLAQLVSDDPELSILKTMLTKDEMMPLLRSPGSLTLFAPTDQSFRKLPEQLLTRLTSGQGCLSSVLSNHLLNHVICSTAIHNTVYIRNQHGSRIELHRDEDDQVLVNGVILRVRDILGTNGVLHIIDEVLVPESARGLETALEAANVTEFKSLLDSMGLVESFDGMNNFTLFAPSDKAVREMPEEHKQKYLNNEENLKNLLMFHVSNPEVQSRDVTDNMVLKTGLLNRHLRINSYRHPSLFPQLSHRITAHCARVAMVDQRTCTGRVQVLDRVLIPPSGDIMDFLANNETFTRMTALLQDSGLAEKLTEEGPWTVLAVPDAVFDNLPEEKLSEMMTNKDKAKEVAELHVLPEMLCCHGVSRDLLFGNVKYQTVGGGRLAIRRTDSGRVHAGPAIVSQCDHTATNGVIHIVNSLIMPNKIRRRNPFHRVRIPGLFEVQFHTL